MRRAIVDARALVRGGVVPAPCHAMLRHATPHHAMRARAMRGGAQMPEQKSTACQKAESLF
eukprot:9613316-Lingulodinium_polyedra.AAC.1